MGSFQQYSFMYGHTGHWVGKGPQVLGQLRLEEVSSTCRAAHEKGGAGTGTGGDCSGGAGTGVYCSVHAHLLHYIRRIPQAMGQHFWEWAGRKGHGYKKV